MRASSSSLLVLWAAAAPNSALQVSDLPPGRQLAASCEQGIVECVNGYAADGDGNPTGQTCADACDGDCCKNGDHVCSVFTGRVCRDGSCDGDYACLRASVGGLIGGSDGTASGPSCVGESSCFAIGIGGIVGSISGASCDGKYACLRLGIGGAVGSISGSSCIGTRACLDLGRDGGNISSIHNCCQSDDECYFDKTDADLPPKCFVTDGPTTAPGTDGPTAPPMTNGPTASPTTDGPTSSESPTTGPTAFPTAGPTLCEDDPDWRRERNPKLSCGYLGYKDTAFRCNRWRGENGILASDACRKTCGSCTVEPTAAPTAAPTTAPTPCGDDPDWRKEGNPKFGCRNVANKNTANRCRRWRGEDGARASDACRKTCDSCGCRDDPHWRKEGNPRFRCRHVADKNTANRCKWWRGENGARASDACKVTCSSCG